MNEELQSTNEELETINDELRQRTDELKAVNVFLEAILASLRVGVIVIDRELRILAWNVRAEELWGLRAEEVEGQHLFNLDIGLPVERLRQPVRECLTGMGTRETLLDAVDRRGKAMHCKIICTPLAERSADIRGVILWIEGEGGNPLVNS